MFFQENGFEKCSCEHGLYVKINDSNDVLIVCLYVDDLTFIGNNLSMLEESKRARAKEFDTMD